MNFDDGIFLRQTAACPKSRAFAFPGAPPRRIFSTDSSVSMTGMERIPARTGGCDRVSEELTISLVIFDFPCPASWKAGPRRYVTKEMMRTLRFSFYWKRNLELRHIDNLKQGIARAEPIEPYNMEIKEDLIKRYRWFLEFTIPSAGVPLTDALC